MQEILINSGWVLLGLALLYFGSGWFVGAAVRLALRAKIPAAVIGATIVALGTSTPELITTVMAASSGHADVALGNIVGSNICNILLALGLAGAVRPMPSDKSVLRWDGPWVLISGGVLTWAIWMGVGASDEAGKVVSNLAFDRVEGIVMLALFVAFIVTAVIRVRRQHTVADEVGAEIAKTAEKHWGTDVVVFLFGLGLLVLGSDRTVVGAVAIADKVGIPEIVVGLTVVAVGTSLPEIATSVMAARKGEEGIAISNVTGSNIQNILLCLGLAIVCAPSGIVPIDDNAATLDLGVMWIATLWLLILLAGTSKIGRSHSLALVFAYAGYLGYLVYRSM